MNIPMFRSYVEGYQEHMFDLQCLAVHQGYWVAYYQSKKPKPTKVILQQMVHEHDKQVKQFKYNSGEIRRPEVDVDKFLAREARLQKLKLTKK